VTRVRLFDGRSVWAVTGHHAIRSLLADPRLSVDPAVGDLPKLSRAQVLARPERSSVMRVLLRSDPPLHSRQRRALMPSLTPKRVHACRPALTAVADACLDELAARPDRSAELVDDYVTPVVTSSMAAMLGFPVQERRRLAAPLHNLAAEPMAAFLGTRLDGGGGGRPTEGVLADLLGQVEAGSLTREEAAAYGAVLVVAGHHTTVSTITVAVPTLLAHEPELRRLRAGEVAWPRAVEELLRFLSLTAGLVRVATSDIEIAGVVVRAGDGLVLLSPAANRDPAVFERPRELDLGRRARQHLTFGFGIHNCIGQHVARLTIEVALRRLLERFPTLRLAVPADRLPTHQGLVFTLPSLPVAW
jgi:pentalenic acid synthase